MERRRQAGCGGGSLSGASLPPGAEAGEIGHQLLVGGLVAVGAAGVLHLPASGFLHWRWQGYDEAVLLYTLALASSRPLFAYATVPVQWMSTLLIITAVQRSELRWMWVLDPAGIAALAEIGRSASSNAELNAQMWLGGAAYAWNRLVLVLASATVAALALFAADGRLGGVTIANVAVPSWQRRRRPGAHTSKDASASLAPATALRSSPTARSAPDARP